MRLLSERAKGYVNRGNKLISEGKKLEAMKIIERGIEDYTKKHEKYFAVRIYGCRTYSIGS